jgi:hypothetical protein
MFVEAKRGLWRAANPRSWAARGVPGDEGQVEDAAAVETGDEVFQDRPSLVGTRHLGLSSVRGRSRVPCPAARMMPAVTGRIRHVLYAQKDQDVAERPGRDPGEGAVHDLAQGV